MSGKHEAIIAEKRSYRRRRLVDAARLLPVFGVAFFSIPMLWSGTAEGTADGGAAEAVTSTTSAMLYIFGIWALLVAASAVISRYLRSEEGDNGGQA